MAAGTGQGQDEGLPRAARLRRRADYQRAYRQGRRRSGAYFVVYLIDNDAGLPRLGITVSRKVGKAAVRQRVKRRVRETFRCWPGRRELPPVDIVVHARPAAAAGEGEALARELRELLGTRRRR